MGDVLAGREVGDETVDPSRYGAVVSASRMS